MLHFRSIPTILTADELVDKVFKRAGKVTTPSHDSFNRFKGTEIARIRSIQNTIDAQFDRYVKSFPSFGNLPPFYQELIQVVANVDKMRKSLGALTWVRARVTEVGDGVAHEIKKLYTDEPIIAARKRFYGRIASLLHQVGKDLIFLNEAREAMKKLPAIDAEGTTIVVAGYPNVGKSSFVARISTGTPEVASYPFTTKGIIVGHREVARGTYATESIQIVDTPGLLDRELEDRNPIELQAILALKHLGNAVIFILDPSEYCGYTLEAQEALLADVRERFRGIPILVAENKGDIDEVARKTPEGRYRTSTLTGEGVDALIDAAVAAAREHRASGAAPGAIPDEVQESDDESTIEYDDEYDGEEVLGEEE